MSQNNLIGPYQWLINTRGYYFTYFINQKNGLNATYNRIWIHYPVTHSITPIGSISDRNLHQYNLGYVRTIKENDYVSFYVTTGLSYRHGNETRVTAYGWFDMKVESKLLNDFGVSIGSRITTTIYKGLIINLGMKYTSFVYRADKGGSIYYDDNGSSQHMFGVSIGVGYAFSFKTKQKGFTE